MLLWAHMCFGLKAAPLLWRRLAAAVSRLIQAMCDTSEMMHQLYLDDPLLILAGTIRMRKYFIAM